MNRAEVAVMLVTCVVVGCGDDAEEATAPAPATPPSIETIPAPPPSPETAAQTGHAEDEAPPPESAYPAYAPDRELRLDRRVETAGDRLSLLAALRSATVPAVKVLARLALRDAEGRVVFAVFAHGVGFMNEDVDEEILEEAGPLPEPSAETGNDEATPPAPNEEATAERSAGEESERAASEEPEDPRLLPLFSPETPETPEGFEQCEVLVECQQAAPDVALARVAWPRGGEPTVDAIVPFADGTCGGVSGGLSFRDFDRGGVRELRARARWGLAGMSPAADCREVERIFDPLTLRIKMEVELESSRAEMSDEAAALCTRAAYRFTDRNEDGRLDITLRRAFFTDRCNHSRDDDGFPNGIRVTEDAFMRRFVRLNEGRGDDECFYRMEREEWHYDASSDGWTLQPAAAP